MAAKPMMARSPSGNRLCSPSAAICTPPTPEKRTRPACVAAPHQRGAEPVAEVLAGDQKHVQAFGARLMADQRAADDENAGAVGRRTVAPARR